MATEQNLAQQPEPRQAIHPNLFELEQALAQACQEFNDMCQYLNTSRQISKALHNFSHSLKDNVQYYQPPSPMQRVINDSHNTIESQVRLMNQIAEKTKIIKNAISSIEDLVKRLEDSEPHAVAPVVELAKYREKIEQLESELALAKSTRRKVIKFFEELKTLPDKHERHSWNCTEIAKNIGVTNKAVPADFLKYFFDNLESLPPDHERHLWDNEKIAIYLNFDVNTIKNFVKIKQFFNELETLPSEDERHNWCGKEVAKFLGIELREFRYVWKMKSMVTSGKNNS